MYAYVSVHVCVHVHVRVDEPGKAGFFTYQTFGAASAVCGMWLMHSDVAVHMHMNVHMDVCIGVCISGRICVYVNLCLEMCITLCTNVFIAACGFALSSGFSRRVYGSMYWGRWQDVLG